MKIFLCVVAAVSAIAGAIRLLSYATKKLEYRLIQKEILLGITVVVTRHLKELKLREIKVLVAALNSMIDTLTKLWWVGDLRMEAIKLRNLLVDIGNLLR